MNRNQHVLVFEGPAGSGKSYLIRELEGTGWYDTLTYFIPDPPQRVRRYDTEIGPYFRDLHAITSMIMSTDFIGHRTNPLLIDRLFLGSLVYRRIKEHIGFEADFVVPNSFDDKMTQKYMLAQLRLAEALIDSYAESINGRVPFYHFHYYILIPTLDHLIDARALAKDRKYPYNPKHERDLYIRLANNVSLAKYYESDNCQIDFHTVWGYSFKQTTRTLKQIHQRFGRM